MYFVTLNFETHMIGKTKFHKYFVSPDLGYIFAFIQIQPLVDTLPSAKQCVPDLLYSHL